jgi:hypothetical protein
MVDLPLGNRRWCLPIWRLCTDNVLRVCNNSSSDNDNDDNCSDHGSGCSDGDGKVEDDGIDSNGSGDGGDGGEDNGCDSVGVGNGSGNGADGEEIGMIRMYNSKL